MVRAASISTAFYTPEPTDNQKVDTELRRIAYAIEALARGHLDKEYVSPAKPRSGDMRHADGASWNPGMGEGLYLYKTAWRYLVDVSATGKAMMNDDGGFMVKLTNKTGAVSVKGEVVTAGSAANNSVTKIIVDIPNPIGVFWESGVADGTDAWVVVSGLADVYFVGNTTRGHLARGFLTADGASYVSGQVLSEAFPVSPFASDKHFYEIGHVLESRTGAGLAKCVLHFN
jgi:hypothetical protein